METQLLLGDCLEQLKNIKDNTIDSIVTDPPYGFSFMGKDWDTVKATKETKSQIVKGLGAGMKMTGLADNVEFQKWVTEWSKECIRVLKPGGYMLAFAGSRMYHRLASGVEDAGFEIRDQIMWIYGSGFPKSHNIGKAIDKIEGNEREVVGIDEDFIRRNPNNTGVNRLVTDASGVNKDNRKKQAVKNENAGVITKGNSEWEGWGTALKPAHEPIVMARKPLVGTVANNVLEWGTGGINIDGCRIGNETRTTPIHSADTKEDNTLFGLHATIQHERIETTEGRFPANIILDEEAGRILDEQSGDRKGMASQNCNNQKLYGGNSLHSSSTTRDGFKVRFNDSGGASRFFYCPKASKKDRDEKNIHPTVKPTDLMQYLIRLVTPKGGVVLDPFTGSGSTGKAAVREGMQFIGIEREEEYFEIAKQRIQWEVKQKPNTTFWD